MRIVNIRCWGMIPGAQKLGGNIWHSDFWPYGFCKILIYLTPVGEGRGTTEVKMMDESIKSVHGPAGSWILFNPTQVIYRGVPPDLNSYERIILEAALVPAFKDNFEPIFAGWNANYPWFPWTEIQT